jgi:calcium-dependent protein kinase
MYFACFPRCYCQTDYGRPIEEIYDGVHDGTVLGSGVSGIVRRVKHRKTGVNYAVKCLDLGLIVNEKGKQALLEEVRIMCQLDHPNIVRLEEVYENESEIFLVQELCTGGDLFDRLDEQSDFHYSEWKCAMLVKQMLSSVRYLHSKNIIHRDLKLENFLFSSTDADSELKMIDFGLSKHFAHPGELQNESVGTPYTIAPEIINGEYDEKVDVWALGVITYLLLSGETPFGGVDGESLISVRTRILKGYCGFEPADIWDRVSNDAKVFIKRLLEPDVSRRPTAREAQRDCWLLTFGKKDAENGHNLSPKLCQALVEFKEYSDMRKFLCEVLSFTLLPEQIADLRREFEKVDPEGEGEISLATLKQVLVESAEEGALGSLTEIEVENMFDAMRVRKTETKIRWHEFIAAGLSQCSFDERNLKLAFDRLDYDRKG